MIRVNFITQTQKNKIYFRKILSATLKTVMVLLFFNYLGFYYSDVKLEKIKKDISKIKEESKKYKKAREDIVTRGKNIPNYEGIIGKYQSILTKGKSKLNGEILDFQKSKDRYLWYSSINITKDSTLMKGKFCEFQGEKNISLLNTIKMIEAKESFDKIKIDYITEKNKEDNKNFQILIKSN